IQAAAPFSELIRTQPLKNDFFGIIGILPGFFNEPRHSIKILYAIVDSSIARSENALDFGLLCLFGSFTDSCLAAFNFSLYNRIFEPARSGYFSDVTLLSYFTNLHPLQKQSNKFFLD